MALQTDRRNPEAGRGRGRGRIAVVVAGLLAMAGVGAPTPAWPADSPAAEVVTHVVGVIDGDTVRIDPPVNGLSELRLAGIEAPKAPLGRPLNRPWPPADRAREALATLTRDAPVRLAFAGQRTDRYRRIVDQVYRADGLWLQGALLRAGMARVHTSLDSRELASEMLAIEEEARAARRGLWASPAYAVVSPSGARDRIGTFALVEGRVVNAKQVKKRVYLNFGADWRDDFTITIDAQWLPLFSEAGLDPLTLAGRSIRVRGWVEKFNGPSIEVTHPERIEILAGNG